MKSLSLAKPLVLVTVGLPGAGKSFFARQFSETFHAPVISCDRLRHILQVHPASNKNDQSIVNDLMLSQMEELFKTQKAFILDGHGATRAERIELRKLARAAGYEMLLISVQTDKGTTQYRSMKRSKQRLDDRYSPSLSADEYAQLAKRFTPPLENEASVVISGKHTYATQARIVLKKLVAAREAEVDTRNILEHQGRKPAGGASGRRNVLVG